MSIWTDNEALVRRLRKLKEFDPVSAYTKNDHDIYVGMHEAINQIEIDQIGHVQGHQDKSGRELNHVEKMNILADELAKTRAMEGPIRPRM